MVAKLREGFTALNAMMALNPAIVAFTGMAAAIGLVVIAAKKLYDILMQIKETFNGHELVRELSVIGKSISNGIDPYSQNKQQGASLFGGAAAVATPTITPILNRPNINAANNQNHILNINMKIDQDGKPIITGVNGSDAINFNSNLGILR